MIITQERMSLSMAGFDTLISASYNTSVKFFARLILLLLIAGSLIYLTYWLWQRQPKGTNEQQDKSPTFTLNKSTPPEDKKTFSSLSIKDGQVLDQGSSEITGKTNPESFVILYSNAQEVLTKANSTGEFKINTNFAEGLNIVSFSGLDKDLKEQQGENFSVFVNSKTKPIKSTISYAGSVKNIFDKVITVSTFSGDKKAKSNTQTEVLLPSPSPKTNNKGVADIRVGDYILAFGSTEKDGELLTEKIEITRENKPQNNKKYYIVNLASVVKNKLFSGKNQKDNNLVEFTLVKNSQISDIDKKLDEKAIVKDKKAIVFIKEAQDQKQVSTVYILP